MANNIDIGENIRRYRKLRGLTQEKLAEFSDLSVKFISMVESKKSQNISIQRLEKIADALDISLATLVSIPEKKDLSINDSRPYSKLLINRLTSMEKNTAELISKNFLDTIHLYEDLLNNKLK
ncbi:helix-turn-helix domain-containing protein [Limosilactobacillus reuteri]|uniref:helix-turn-helix domain-containing protein n=1 Tax=Limosilactobacillus reuteri TaxID=1598 RepID=UPI001E4EF1BE|nr:helix-turn-helix transcriptional regulator [Limosilactobacillus reuteri]MCC4371765.1 helix-turn-helix domain-containing protein [Limosilactobacillus reuteri]MCC4399243.1 helix-turn-helix domain-containing protein [Limosilactobacillus reuteri]MCC4404123.1 helix-turn-helix domain-containing protein [Limosilactobacillus reuteri]MCC4502299.1 helix-turn-helix domain-containing protein [Limosilactobacillus reuteri]